MNHIEWRPRNRHHVLIRIGGNGTSILRDTTCSTSTKESSNRRPRNVALNDRSDFVPDAICRNLEEWFPQLLDESGRS